MQDTRPQLIAITILTLVGLFMVIPFKNKPNIPILSTGKIELGIDLAGGAELRYRALFEKGDEKRQLQSIVDVLINRVKARKALHEPRITTSGEDMIVIQIPGVDKDSLVDMRKLIESVGKLELKEVADKRTMDGFNVSGIVPDGYDAILTKTPLPDHGIKEKALVARNPIITGSDLVHASSEPNVRGGGNWIVNFKLSDNGAKQFDDAAKRLYDRKLTQGEPQGLIAIILDSNVVSMPRVNAEHFGGSGIIEGGFTKESAHDLAIILRSGSLPVPIGRIADNGEKIPKQPESENFVGPSLGQDSIMRGLAASILGVILVALFMIVYYRGGGIISVVGLVLNLIWLLALMTLFSATMTLPGIAGIVLTIGLAVDANILIYERVREEMLKGKTATQAFEAGYDRAFEAIMDSNVTSLLAGLVLYYFGTGPVQGFAVTLVIGILTTLISVLWACKVMEKAAVTGGFITQWKMMQLFKVPAIDYVKLAKPCGIASVIVAIASIAIFASRGKEQFGIEFTGGTSLSFTFEKPVGIDDVRARIGSIKDANGIPKYHDAEIMTMAPTTSLTSMRLVAGAESRDFQLNTRAPDRFQVRTDIQNAFAPPEWKGAAFAREPFEFLDAKDKTQVPQNERWGSPKDGRDGTPGGGFYVFMIDDGKLDFVKIHEKLAEKFKASKNLALTRDPNELPVFGGDKTAGTLEKDPSSAGGLARVKILFLKIDVEPNNGIALQHAREEIKALAADANSPFKLAEDPFSSVQSIGPAVASQLMNTTIIAMFISAVLMIIYIAIRFHFFIFGVAAVIALTHDSIISLGLLSLAGWIVPKSWGLSFELNMSTFAALLTIVGYSVNDKIVTFDRIRENLALLKKEESMKEIINRSINETLGRSVLTSVTVWIVCMILYLFTMTSAGGIASFSFPMLMGVIISMYSSIYIASPVLLWLFGGKRPKAA